MTKQHNIIVIGTAVIISAGIWIIALNRQDGKKKKALSAKVFKGLNGWGYDILLNDTLFIHQAFIPVIETNKGFLQKQQAEKAAAKILQKLQH
ncbi:MAG TPA: DUF4907 domain-containing protein, partial [Chitinophagaceae bacterium]|nr:DUF4907 domain-containing protein [Chitinophagaceae bacterium]